MHDFKMFSCVTKLLGDHSSLATEIDRTDLVEETKMLLLLKI